MKSLTKDDIDRAVSTIEVDGFNPRNGSTIYCFVCENGHHYPPKVVRGLAEGRKPSQFSGGKATNNILKRAAPGCDVTRCDNQACPAKKPRKPPHKPQQRAPYPR